MIEHLHNYFQKEQLKISSGDLQKQVKVDNEDNSRAFSIHATAKMPMMLRQLPTR